MLPKVFPTLKRVPPPPGRPPFLQPALLRVPPPRSGRPGPRRPRGRNRDVPSRAPPRGAGPYKGKLGLLRPPGTPNDSGTRAAASGLGSRTFLGTRRWAVRHGGLLRTYTPRAPSPHARMSSTSVLGSEFQHPCWVTWRSSLVTVNLFPVDGDIEAGGGEGLPVWFPPRRLAQGWWETRGRALRAWADLEPQDLQRPLARRRCTAGGSLVGNSGPVIKQMPEESPGLCWWRE